MSSDTETASELAEYVSIRLTEFSKDLDLKVLRICTCYSADAIDKVLFRLDMMIKPDDLGRLKEFLGSQSDLKENPDQIEPAVEGFLGYQPNYFWRDFAGVEKDTKLFIDAYKRVLSALQTYDKDRVEGARADLEQKVRDMKNTRFGKEARYIPKPDEYWDDVLVESVALPFEPPAVLKVSLNRAHGESLRPGLQIGPGYVGGGYYSGNDITIALSTPIRLRAETREGYISGNWFDTSEHGEIHYFEGEGYFTPFPNTGGPAVGLGIEGHSVNCVRFNIDIPGTGVLNRLFNHFKMEYDEEN